MKKSRIAVICAAAVLLLGGSAVYGLRSRKTSEKEYAKQKQTADSQKAAEEERSKIPVMTEGDTDDERRYGYEVLYKHDGVTITVEKCERIGSSADLSLKFKNDTDHFVNVSDVYIAPNSYISNQDFSVTVPSHSEKTETIKNINDLLSDSDQIKDIRLRLKVEDMSDETVRKTPQMHIFFDIKGTQPSHNNSDQQLYSDEETGIKLWYNSNEDITDDDGNKIGTVIWCYVQNDSDTDQDFYIRDYTCYSGGEPVDTTIRLMNDVPAHTGHYVLLRFYPDDEDSPAPDIERVKFSPRTDSSETGVEMLVGDMVEINLN